MLRTRAWRFRMFVKCMFGVFVCSVCSGIRERVPKTKTERNSTKTQLNNQNPISTSTSEETKHPDIREGKFLTSSCVRFCSERCVRRTCVRLCSCVRVVFVCSSCVRHLTHKVFGKCVRASVPIVFVTWLRRACSKDI